MGRLATQSPARASSRRSLKHAGTVAVAVAYTALSLPDGGGGSEAISIGALLVWWAVIVGLAVGGWPRTEVPRPGLVAGACLGGLAALTLLSLAWANDDGKAFIEFVRVSGYLGLLVLVLISSPAGGSRSWLNGLAIGLVTVAALALGSRLVGFLPGAREVSALLPADRGRLSYPIGYWNGLAAAMATGVVLVTWVGAVAGLRQARTLAVAALPACGLALFMTSSRGGMGATAVGLIVLVALVPRRAPLLWGLAIGGAGAGILIGIAATMSELLDRPSAPASVSQGHVLFFAVLAVTAAVGAARYLADQRIGTARLARIPRPALAVLAVALVVGIAVANPIARFNDFKSPPQLPKPGSATPASKLSSETSSGRYQFWQSAIDAYKSDPVTGIGAGEFESYWNLNGTLNTTIRHAHSLFLETLAELGVAGLLLVLGFLGSGLASGWRRWRTRLDRAEIAVALAVLAAGIVSAALEWTWYLTATFVPVIVAVALLTGPATQPAPATRWRTGSGNGNGAAPSRPPSRGRFGWGVATLLAGWTSILAALSLLLTAARLSDSQADARNRDYPAAAEAAEDAQTLQPWSAEPRLQLALVYEAEGHLNQARSTLNEAIARAPYDYRIYLVAARIDAARGRHRVALGELKTAESMTRQPDLIAAQKRPILHGEVPR